MGFCCDGFGWGSWSGLGFLGPIIGLLFFVGVVAMLGLGTAWLVRQLSRQPAASDVGVDPLEIARQRLAAGKITVPEFEEIRDRLQH
jgi:uncharacterized membrane protein